MPEIVIHEVFLLGGQRTIWPQLWNSLGWRTSDVIRRSLYSSEDDVNEGIRHDTSGVTLAPPQQLSPFLHNYCNTLDIAQLLEPFDHPTPILLRQPLNRYSRFRVIITPSSLLFTAPFQVPILLELKLELKHSHQYCVVTIQNLEHLSSIAYGTMAPDLNSVPSSPRNVFRSSQTSTASSRRTSQPMGPPPALIVDAGSRSSHVPRDGALLAPVPVMAPQSVAADNTGVGVGPGMFTSGLKQALGKHLSHL